MTSKRRVASYLGEDRISKLPEHLIDSVLDELPVEEAVRTSILSKKWRYKWTTIRKLIFDVRFFKKYSKDGALGRNGTIRIINKVLAHHTGPILKFLLHMPNMSADNFEEVDQWILLLPKNGVRELTLTNSSERYKLPSYICSCLELTELSLENCLFKPPLGFEGFINLKDLWLKNIDFSANLCGTQINLLELKTMWLDKCTNVCNFSIKARKLYSLIVSDCPDIMLLRLSHISRLALFYLYFRKRIEDNVRVERMTLDMMLSNLPDLECLGFDGVLFKLLIAEKIPKWLPRAVNSLWSLQLLNYQLGDLNQLHGILCLLRKSPSLEVLQLNHMQMDPHVDVGPALDHLESPNCLDCTLNMLQTVEIVSIEGSRPELLFVKLILAHSPSFEKFTITPSGASDVQKRLDITKDVLQFPRASTIAKIFFTDPKA